MDQHFGWGSETQLLSRSLLHSFVVQQSAGGQRPHLSIWLLPGYWLQHRDTYFLSSNRLAQAHSQDFQDQQGWASHKCTNALTIFQTWVKQVSQSTLIGGVEKETTPLDERMSNTTFQGGGCVASFTIYHKESELLFSICPSCVLSFSLAAIRSRPRCERRWVCTQLDGFWLPGPSRWLTLTLVWGTVVLSSVHLFTRGFSLILDFCQMHLSSGQLLLISPLAPGIQFHTFSLN